MKKIQKLISIYKNKVFFRNLLSAKSSLLLKNFYRYSFKVLFSILLILVICHIFNSILQFSGYKENNNLLSLIILILIGIIFIVSKIDEILTHSFIRKNYAKYYDEKIYKENKFIIIREIQKDYLFEKYLKKENNSEVKKLIKRLKRDKKNLTNTFKISDTTFSILLIPLSLAILQWHFGNVKDIDGFRTIYIYSIFYIMLILTLFFSIKSVKNTYFLAKKERYKRLISILQLIEK